jgi:hypothetical protein
MERSIKYKKLIEAYLNEETIQLFVEETEEWCDLDQEPTWAFDSCQYRIKPEGKMLNGDFVSPGDKIYYYDELTNDIHSRNYFLDYEWATMPGGRDVHVSHFYAKPEKALAEAFKIANRREATLKDGIKDLSQLIAEKAKRDIKLIELAKKYDTPCELDIEIYTLDL